MRPATVLLILSSWHNYAQREVPCYTAAEYGGGGCFCFCVFVFVFINNIVLSQCAYDYVSCIELKEHSYAHRVVPRYTAAEYAGGEGGVGWEWGWEWGL